MTLALLLLLRCFVLDLIEIAVTVPTKNRPQWITETDFINAKNYDRVESECKHAGDLWKSI